jgi:DNA-binding response OmpR family regulator
VNEATQNQPSSANKPSILHVCNREMLRPLRDQILRVSGYDVDSALTGDGAFSLFSARPYDLVLIDVEGEHGIPEAEQLCSEIKTARHEQPVAFVCNWRVATLTDCPDDIVRTEFDPAAFVKGVRDILAKNGSQ